MFKRIALGVWVFIGIAHIGAFGHLIGQRNPMQVSLPEAGDYTSYNIIATPDGYSIEYIGNDPRVLTQETETSRGGLFGNNRETRITTEYTQDGARNQSAEVMEEGKLSAEQVACIEAAGGGRSSGAIVGTSLAASVIPFVSGVPYVGWLASGWVAMLGGDIGGNLGAEVATIANGC